MTFTIVSPREKQLLRRFAQEKTNRQIAFEIGGTEQQVADQRQKLSMKFAIHSDDQWTAVANELAPWPIRKRQDGGHQPPP